MERPHQDFKITTLRFQGSMLVHLFEPAPEESALFWKAVALRQAGRLDKAVEVNRQLRAEKAKADRKVESLEAKINGESD